MTDVGQRVVRDLRNQLFRHILDQSAASSRGRRPAQLMSRITNDVNQVQQAVSETIGDLLREGAGAGRLRGAAVLLRLRGWRSSASPARRSSSIRWSGSASACAARRAAARSSSSTCRTSRAEAFTGHRIVKAFGAEARESRRFGDASQRLYRTNLKVTSTLAMLPPLMEFLGGLGDRRRCSGTAASEIAAEPTDAGRLPRRSSPRRS